MWPSFAFRLPFACIGKGRPRVGRFHNVYTPKKTADFEAGVQQFLKKIYENLEAIPSTAAITVSIRCVYRPPKSWSKKLLSLVNYFYLPKITKPDIDNAQKILLDSFNKLLFKDDKNVFHIESEKVWGPRDEIIVSITSCSPWEPLEPVQ